MDTPIRFRWLGVGGIELRVNDQVLVIDPYFTRAPFWQTWGGRVRPNRELAAEKVQYCDYVLVTHPHIDHLLDVPNVVHNTGAIALGSPNTCQLLAVLGVPEKRIREVEVGDKLTLGGFQVEVLPAEHMTFLGRPVCSGPLSSNLQPPLRALDYRMDCCFSFLLHVGGRHLLDWRSEQVESMVPADVLFIKPQTPAYQSLLRVVQPKIVIPMHWDDFFRPLSKPIRPVIGSSGRVIPLLKRVDMTHFGRMVEQIAPETKVVIPEMFRAYDLNELT
jgi:L-ascorbate metabolism protein UlaG (beta-lactamase superfamily)